MESKGERGGDRAEPKLDPDSSDVDLSTQSKAIKISALGSGAKDIMCGRVRNRDTSSGDALLRRAVSSVYSEMQRALLPLFEPHAATFNPNQEEQPLEYMELYQQYERLLEEHLERFAAAEGFDSQEQFIECLAAAASGNGRSERMLAKLLQASNYKKFCVFMKNACQKIAAQEELSYGEMSATFASLQPPPTTSSPSTCATASTLASTAAAAAAAGAAEALTSPQPAAGSEPFVAGVAEAKGEEETQIKCNDTKTYRSVDHKS